MNLVEHYEARGGPTEARVIRMGRGLPAIIANTYNLADAEMIVSALNNGRGAVEALREMRDWADVYEDNMGPDDFRRRDEAFARADAILRGQ